MIVEADKGQNWIVPPPHEDAEDFEYRRQPYAIRSDFSGRPAQGGMPEE